MKQQRICFLVESIFTIGGVQRVTAVIAQQLSRHFDVTIVTFDPPEAEDTSLYGLSGWPIHYRFFRYPPIPKAKKQLCKAYSLLYRRYLPQIALTHRGYAHSSFPSELRQALANELNQGHYDVIIGVHAPIATRLAALRSQLKCQRLIGWVHNSFDAMFQSGSFYAGRELERYFVYQFQRLSRTVVLYNRDADRYWQEHSYRPDVIYNPLTLKPGESSKGDSHKFLAVGRMTKGHKGFDLLLKAFALFHEKNTDWTLDIVGEGPEHDQLLQMAKEAGIGQTVFFHPFTTDIQRYYSEAQVFVLSSRWEGLPLVLAEAMSHGLPVVSSDLPTCLEAMGDFALYFTTGDYRELALRLEEATHIDWPRKSAEAKALAAKFDVEIITRQWIDLIQSVV